MNQIKIEQKYLILPLNYTAKIKRVCFYQDNKLVLEFDTPLDFLNPDYFKYVDVSEYTGGVLNITAEPDMDLMFEQTDTAPPEDYYGEKYRPLIHFTTKQGWLNDPNGMVFDGTFYHLFYQYNPYSSKWGNIHWGHAVSRDLIHWEEREAALCPDDMGYMFSGSGIIDKKNLTGLKENENDVILLYYTAAGGGSAMSKGKKFTQCLAYSTDGGISFKKYEKNPVVDHIEAENRDPKIVYSEELSAYIMAIFLCDDRYMLLTSTDLLKWKYMQEISIPNDAECPDFYPIFLDNDPRQIRWILSGASDYYLVGNIKSGKYCPAGGAKRLHYGNNSYAAQTFSDISETDGRRIRFAWNNMEFPASYFCGSMCFAAVLNLKTIGGEEALTIWPVKEIENLFVNEQKRDFTGLGVGNHLLDKRNFGAHWLEFVINIEKDSLFEFNLFGMNIEVNTDENAVRCMDKSMPVFINENEIRLMFIADVTGFEIFCGDGQAFMSMGFICDYNLNRFELNVKKGKIEKLNCRMAELKKIWN